MARVKLNFAKLSLTEKIARARLIVSKMTANAAAFPNPVPALSEVTAAIEAMDKSYRDALEARARAKELTAQLEDDEDALASLMSRLVSFVDSASGGDEQVILSAGMDVREPSVPTSQPPAPPQNLNATAGDKDGEIDLSWDTVPGAVSYIVQMSSNPPTDNSWSQAAIGTASKQSVGGLTSGQKYWFRVAAIGSAGQSGWSDPTVKMAP